MLPFFEILLPSKLTLFGRMSTADIPSKARRNKKVEVAVHRSSKDTKNAELHKTYSAQFNGRKCKQKSELEKSPVRVEHIPIGDFNYDSISRKTSRKVLKKENERLLQEHQELVDKMSGNESQFHKKLSKLKDKLSTSEHFNKELSNENDILKTQYEDLLIHLETYKMELEVAKNCQSCVELNKLLDRSNNGYQQLQINNKELTEDMNMLKNVVYRLNVQMERYQEKLRLKNVKMPSSAILGQQIESIDNVETVPHEVLQNILPREHMDHPHTPIAWGKVNSHTIGPLLDSYQETIREKDEIIHSYEAELSKFTGKLKDIIRENASLHKRLTEDSECSAKLNVEIEKIQAELKSTREQNDLLIKKCAIKQDKLEEVLRCYEQKVEHMRRDHNVVLEEYHKNRAEISGLKEKNKSLVDAQSDFKNERQNYIPVSVHNSSVNECKKWYEELKLQYENEKSKLKETVTGLNNQISELSSQISAFSSVKTELENKIKISEKHIKKVEMKYLDLQHTLNEVQVSRSACRKQLHKAMEFARDLVAEQESLLKALSQRNYENKAVKRLGSDIATRMDSLKNQLKTVQRDAWQELETVEQRIQEKDSLILAMKQDHEEEIERLKQIIKNKEETNLLLKDNSSIPVPHYLLFRDRNMNV